MKYSTLTLVFLLSTANSQEYDEANRLLISDKGTQYLYDQQPVTDKEAKADKSSNIMPLTEWTWSGLGTGIGLAILDYADFDGDGSLELITTGNGYGFNQPTSIFILEEDFSTVLCTLDFESLPFDYHIAQMDNDPALEIIIVNEFGTYQIDGKTCQMEVGRQFSQSIDSAGLGDVNNDGIIEVVYSKNNDLYKSTWNSSINEDVRYGFGGSKIILDKLTREDGDEIGIISSVVYILNGNDLSTITELDSYNPTSIAFGDITNDDQGEVILKSYASVIAISLDTEEELFSVSASGGIATIKVLDYNQDGKDEVLVGEAQWGDVIVLDEFGNATTTIDNPSHGTTNVLIADFKNGSGYEYIWGSGHTSSGSDFLYRASLTTELITWRSELFNGIFQVSNVGDFLDNEGSQISVSYSSGLKMLDSATGRLLDKEFITQNDETGQYTGIASGNTDSDTAWEICYTGGGSSYAFLACRDSLSEEVEWHRDVSGSIYELKLIDIDSDGINEILAVANQRISVYNGSNGFLIWQTTDLSLSSYYGSNNLIIMNNEIWYSDNGEIHKIDKLTGSLISTLSDTGLSNIQRFNNSYYAIENSNAVVEIDPISLDVINTLYTNNSVNLNYLLVSQDGKVLLTASGSIPNLNPFFVSTTNEFPVWELGEVLMYDAVMPTWHELYISISRGVKKYDVSIIDDELFKNSFE